jgi:hypothetical protein
MRKSPGTYYVEAGRSNESMCRAAAFHEAGHAVVAIVSERLDVHFVILHVRSSQTTFGVGGYTETTFAPVGTLEETLAAYGSPELLRTRAVQILAGPAAEWLVNHDDASAEDVHRGAEDDDRQAIQLAVQAVGPDDCLPYYRSCVDEARELLRGHWGACCAVAEYLLEHPNQEMPGARVRQLVAENRSVKPGRHGRSQTTCLRCPEIALAPVDSSPEIEIFDCPACHRRYARKPGRSLTFAWLHPVSLPLYSVLFDSDPLSRVSHVAEQFIKENPVEALRRSVEEIDLELTQPTQHVRDIVDSPQAEEQCREFLRAFVTKIRARLDAVGI